MSCQRSIPSSSLEPDAIPDASTPAYVAKLAFSRRNPVRLALTLQPARILRLLHTTETACQQFTQVQNYSL